MTVVFSTSSPLASVALLGDRGEVLSRGEQLSEQRASGTVLSLLNHCLHTCGLSLSDARLFVADLGPGSFTGVKVGVTIAKTMGFAKRIKVAGVTAFDLIDRRVAVAIPSRKGEFYLREPGQEPRVVSSVPAGAAGYGAGGAYPTAANATLVISSLLPMNPEMLVPLYVAEPSISKPRDARLLRGPNA